MIISIKKFGTVGSTNDELKKAAADGAQEGLVYISETQSSGKGRRGRSFISPKGGLYLSLLLRPSSADHLTAITAVAARRAIKKSTGAECSIKWPNDLYLNGKKVGGILTESKFTDVDRPEYVIIGIGINVKHTDFDDDLRKKASSLEDCGFFCTADDLADCFLREFDMIYSHGGDWLDEYRKRSFIPGKKITVTGPNDSYEAEAVSIDDDGHLIVNRPGAGSITLISGEVRIIENNV